MDLSNINTVLAASKLAVQPLRNLYRPDAGRPGAWQFAGSTILQFHESGMYYNTLLNYRKNSGDPTFDSFVTTNIGIESHGSKGVFSVGTPGGDYTDDLLWWNLAAITGAEIFGPNTAYGTISLNSFNDLYRSWDNRCGGGIIWMPAINGDANYAKNNKLAIAQAQFIEAGARLLKLKLGDARTVKSQVDQVYNFMKAKFIRPDLSIIDHIYTKDCNLDEGISFGQWSYVHGKLVSALLELYEATGDITYYNDGMKFYQYMMKTFFNAQTNIRQEPKCANNGCARLRSPDGFGWPVYQALAKVHAVTSDINVKNNIKNVLIANTNNWISVTRCNTNTWNCMRKLRPGIKFALPDGTNIRDQIEMMELLNALGSIAQRPQQQQQQQPAAAAAEMQSSVPATTLKLSASPVVSSATTLKTAAAPVIDQVPTATATIEAIAPVPNYYKTANQTIQLLANGANDILAMSYFSAYANLFMLLVLLSM